jgi:hypothetical protein
MRVEFHAAAQCMPHHADSLSDSEKSATGKVTYHNVLFSRGKIRLLEVRKSGEVYVLAMRKHGARREKCLSFN